MSTGVIIVSLVYLGALVAAYYLGREGVPDLESRRVNSPLDHQMLEPGEVKNTLSANDDSILDHVS